MELRFQHNGANVVVQLPTDSQYPMHAAWHRNDNAIQYKVQDSLHESWLTFLSEGTEDAGNAWEGKYGGFAFTEVSSGHDVLINTYSHVSNVCGSYSALGCHIPDNAGALVTSTELGPSTIWIPERPFGTALWTNNPTEFNLDTRRQVRLYFPLVMMHELGHAAGLGHPPHTPTLVSTSIMIAEPRLAIPDRRGRQVPQSVPLSYDIAGLRNLYDGHMAHQ